MAEAARTILLRYKTDDLKEAAKLMRDNRRAMSDLIKNNKDLDAASKRRLRADLKDRAAADRELLKRAKAEMDLERRGLAVARSARSASAFDPDAPGAVKTLNKAGRGALQGAGVVEALAAGNVAPLIGLLGRAAGPAGAILLTIDQLRQFFDSEWEKRVAGERARVEFQVKAQFEKELARFREFDALPFEEKQRRSAALAGEVEARRRAWIEAYGENEALHPSSKLAELGF